MRDTDSLERYLYKEIIPKYSEFDPAHREDHAKAVIRQAEKLLKGRDAWLAQQDSAEDIWQSPIDREILLTAAACHDLGLTNGRERHHLDSGTIIRNDSRLREWFDEGEIETIAEAAEDHRASGKSAPRSIYGMIVAEADRLIEANTIILRTVQFGMKHYPDLDEKGHISRAIEHLHEKYGRNGYLKLWIPWSDNARQLDMLRDLIDDSEGIRNAVTEIYRNMTEKMKTKVYFAGSIRGGRIDADLYRRIISYIQKTDIVLTEHIGNPDLNLKEQGMRDFEIYDQDTAWLRESDILIGECSCPSLGVGYELAYAEKLGKPCHIFYDRTKTNLSAMLTGNPYFHIHPYETEEEIYSVIDTLLRKQQRS